jgi:hypothetical protein
MLNFIFTKLTITILSVLLLTACSSSDDEVGSLSLLTVSAGTINPKFDQNTYNYTLTATSASTTVTPTHASTTGSILVNDISTNSDTASAWIPLSMGNNVITIVSSSRSGGFSSTYTVTVTRVITSELLDPMPGASNQFGSKVIQLANRNIVVSDPGDFSVASNSGAVHLYSLNSSTPIASIYGDVADDRLGNSSITALTNNNYVIASAGDDEGGIVNAGSVRLMHGSTGVQIGAALAGDVTSDNIGSTSITALANNNYVVASAGDDEGGIVNAGSVRLMNGFTGVQIGTTLAGDVTSDNIGISSITALANNNYVVASAGDDEGGIVDAGSVRLVDGSTGVQIGATLAGDVQNDNLGVSSITALANNNYVVASAVDDEGGIVDAGSVRLVDGSTGVQVGATLAGDVTRDNVGSTSITALDNNNYVVASADDDEGGIVNAGSVRLVNGSTGVQIGATLAGDVTNDYLGSSSIAALTNNNYVVASNLDDEGGIEDAGSVRLVDGSTGVQIGAALAGDVKSDYIGVSSITALANNNYVVASAVDDEGSIVDAGSIRLMNGSTGVQIGATLAGDVANDYLGGSSITALTNNNYVVASADDDEGGIADAGSVRLVDGSTGVQVGATLAGDVTSDKVGSTSITALDNNNYVVASAGDDEGSIVDAGSVRLMNGSTGDAIGAAIVGSTGSDMQSVGVLKPVSGDYLILSQPNADKAGQSDAGMVLLAAP